MIEITEEEIVIEIEEQPEIVVEVGDGPILPKWGEIGGVLSNQRDLQGALDEKADSDNVYTKGQMDIALASKADQSYVDEALDEKADIDDVYNKSEMDTALAGKSDVGHGHAGVYSPINHNHDSAYAAKSHDHDGVYSPVGHNHDAAYAAVNHNHDGVYAAASHTHDGLYYTESEVDTKLAGKQDSLTFDTTPTSNSSNPVTSGGVKTALDLKANLASPAFTGSPTAPKQSKGNNSTRLATTSFVQTALGDFYAKTAVDGLLLEKADVIVCEASGNPLTVGDAAAAPAVGLTVGIEAVQTGMDDPAPSNIRPILGWTGINAVRTNGKNLWCPDWVIVGGPNSSPATITNTASVRSVVMPVEPGKTYTMSKISSNRFRYAFTAVYPKVGVRGSNMVNIDSETSETFTVPDGYAYFVCSVGNNEANIEAVLASVQIEEGSAATAYEAWQGVSIPISFPSSAGTVYGGVLDVTSGVLTVTHGQIGSYAGESLPGKWISDRDVYAAGTSPTTGAQVVYELALPLTYELTPAELSLLKGQNIISADSGAVSLSYRADTKLYVDGKFAELQALILEN